MRKRRGRRGGGERIHSNVHVLKRSLELIIATCIIINTAQCYNDHNN